VKRISAIVWTKDRPMQVDALLRTMRRCAPELFPVDVLMRATTEEFSAGYQLLNNIWAPFIRISTETSFKADLCRILDCCSAEHILGLCDDHVFIRPLPTDIPITVVAPLMALSLRLHDGVNYCLLAGLTIVAPRCRIEGDLHVWRWVDCDPRGCWGYPMPVDSNVYNCGDFRRWAHEATYDNPSELEVWLNSHRDANRPMMAHLSEAVLLSVANNNVAGSGNPSGDQDAVSLNRLWLSGKRIDVAPFENLCERQCHIVRPYTFKDRR